jgi:hypothetical protein
MEARHKTILTIGENVSQISAKMLAQSFFQQQEINVVEFKKDSETFANADFSDLNSILILGHGGLDSYGSLTPKEFARIFAENFAKSFTSGSRFAVDHLYLVGCNIGLIHTDGQSVAQQIINELHAKGFTEVVLHCVSYLSKKKNNHLELAVDVITNPGLKGLQENLAELSRADGEIVSDNGFIKAALKDNDKIHELLIKGANPRVELDKADNIFIANEPLEKRSERIAKAFREKNELNLKNVIKLLKIQRRYLQIKGGAIDLLKAVALHAYIKDLSKCDEANWKQQFASLAKRANLNPIFNKDSTSLALINYINHDDQAAVHAIQLNQNAIFQDLVIIEPSNTRLEKLRDRAVAVDGVLEYEINRLKSSKFSQSEPFKKEIALKTKKRVALDEIIKAASVEAMVALAQQYMADADVVKGRSSRTNEFLQELLKDHQSAAQLEM